MRITLLLFSVCFLSGYSMQSQILKDVDSLGVVKVVDSLFIDHDIDNYSLRIFSNYKVKRFTVRDDDSKTRFTPNNPFGVGVGFASRKILVDVAFNLKTNKDEITSRFDLQGTTIIGKNHFVNLYVQTYKGYNVRNNYDEPTIFRGDIKSATVGINYLYTLSEIEFSFSLLKAGLAQKNKDIYITGGIGGFAVFDYFSGKSTILTEQGAFNYNEQANIKKYSSNGVGVMGGFLSAFMLPHNFVASVNVMPGIAVMNKKVKLMDDSYKPSNPFLYKVDYTAALFYNVKRYYISLIYNGSAYSTSLDFDNTQLFSLSKAKLAFGYKLGSRK
ncbi:DUF4421 domain-containing protein [Bizionia argentinensis JUB59]|uniref:DUF4421 domain-containing protein n=1 Tax=Bizionia argentinensis JUB59 TaxID=1046627 RepID=G2EBY9_9FLAO|nr:DUF4421 family protein [Bizionia argentinensis]EGV43963.2 DUF4421 domain-containing protein [Bizionia argentinensis JUB59]